MEPARRPRPGPWGFIALKPGFIIGFVAGLAVGIFVGMVLSVLLNSESDNPAQIEPLQSIQDRAVEAADRVEQAQDRAADVAEGVNQALELVNGAEDNSDAAPSQ